MKIIIAILVFSALIIFHELGHFLLAKKNGIIVDEFSLGMGPKLLSFEKGGTVYAWKLLPFGGSCMMRGEDDDEQGEGTFNSASVLGRISVVAAGPIFNFILAFVLALLVMGFVGSDPSKVIGFPENSPAEKAGLQTNDRITAINGYHVDIGRDLYNYETFQGLKKEPITLTYERDGQEHTVMYQPAYEDRRMLGFNYVADQSAPQITEITLDMPMHKAGIMAGDVITAIDGVNVQTGLELMEYFEEHPMGEQEISITYTRNGKENTAVMKPSKTTHVELGFYYNMTRQRLSFLDTIKYSFVELKYWVKTTVESLQMLFSGKVTVNDMSGPVGVVKIIGDTYEESREDGALLIWMSMFNMMILLSVNLGIMNLLPLPALDGGRLVFLIIEGIRGKSINRNTEGMIHFAGFMILLAFIVYVTIHDIFRFF